MIYKLLATFVFLTLLCGTGSAALYEEGPPSLSDRFIAFLLKGLNPEIVVPLVLVWLLALPFIFVITRRRKVG